MKKLIENYINGNLTEAKEQARRQTWNAIFNFLQMEYGWSIKKAQATANYLKGKGSFQAACDAV